MARNETITSITARRDALLHRAGLAEREGNFSLSQTLRRKAQEVSPTRVVELPDVGTLEELWPAVGGTRHGDGGRPWWEVSGMWRRLAAATSSIASRGTDSRDFALSETQADGFVPFVWESHGGAWGHRHWRVTGLIALRGEQLVVNNSTIAVESTARLDREAISEWTAFTGRALDSLLAERLSWVIAQFAARQLAKGDFTLSGWKPVPLDEDEVEAYHDLHPSPVAAWETTTGRVVLEDDACGSAYIFCAPAQKTELISAFFAEIEREVVDLSLPVSGALPEPRTAEQIGWAIQQARWLALGYSQAFSNEPEAEEAVKAADSMDATEGWAMINQSHQALANRVLADMWRRGQLN